VEQQRQQVSETMTSERRKELGRLWRERNPGYGRKKRLENPERYAEYARKYREKNPDKVWESNQKQRRRRKTWTLEQRRDKQRKYLYGVPEGWFSAQKEKQGGVCAICSLPAEVADSKGRDLHVDHNHTTGQVRGLLCSKCNCLIGLAGESFSLLDKVKEYLNKYAPNK